MRMLRSPFFCLIFLLLSAPAMSADIYVSLKGSDRNNGSREQPLATVAMALRKARELRRLHDPSIDKGINILVEEGVYYFNAPLFIRPEDSGTEQSPTLIRSAGNKPAVFSGGIPITSWKKLTERIAGLPQQVAGKIYVASIPFIGGQPFAFRQLWVNAVKATRARTPNADSMNRILSWDHASETGTIPKPSGMDLLSTEGMEMVIHQWWAIAMLRIRSIEDKGRALVLHFQQPESHIQSEHPWPAPWISKETGNSAFFLTNAIQFLDQPGEWFLDRRSSKLYYYPRAGEQMEKAFVVAPFLETLVQMEGTIDHPVQYVSFNNISFQHSTWMRPSQQGHVPHQAGMYMLDAYSLKIPGTAEKKTLENQAWVGRPAAAVLVRFTAHTSFEHCRFEHLSSTALDYARGNKDDWVKGNLFKDIGGSAILGGIFSDEATEVHLPYRPSDERELTNGLQITNNLVTDATNEDWGTLGIGAGYVKNINISHNELCALSYTGISLGWGWTKSENAMRDNKITANKIHHYARHHYDCAGIYTQSAQPGTMVSENYIDSIYLAPYAHLPEHWFYLYTDEGSSYITVKDNWCPSEKFLQNANGPGNNWQNNGPQVSEAIKNAAGLEQAYRYLLVEKPVVSNWPVNHQSPVTK